MAALVLYNCIHVVGYDVAHKRIHTISWKISVWLGVDMIMD